MTYDKLYEQELLDFKMRMLHAEIHMQAMVAENKQREFRGESMAYSDEDFVHLIADIL
jgi:hypothetical protein